MQKILYTLFSVAVLASCSSSYNIQGTSNISRLDGQMLYLNVIDQEEIKSIDSCDVLHGSFNFIGSLDTVRLASVYIDKESLLPVVLESGNITVSITATQQTATGTPLNDKLCSFLKLYSRQLNEMAELTHRHDRAIMNGDNMDIVNAQLALDAQKISEKTDKLVTSFIEENFDNVLGPGVFMMVTAGAVPALTPWIDALMSKATSKFKNDPYVKNYMFTAQKIQNIQNGTESLQQEPTPSSLQNTAVSNATTPQTAENMQAQTASAGAN